MEPATTVLTLLPIMIIVFYLIPIVFIVWVTFTVIKLLKQQSKLLGEINEKMNK
ncbi:hypothetical protein [Lysinibacillus sp. 54212]|uniref:hypothetical protein n=1 Tax=Lysinibacillus sp. 54212 TaxID=3119829 RepID=UPI002FC582C5